MTATPFVRSQFVAIGLASVAFAAAAADECRVTITHLGDGASRRPLLTTVAVLSVGDVTRQEIDWLNALRNDGPHDVRATLSGAASRQLRRGEADPAAGRYGSRVKLLRLECLPTRSAAQGAGAETTRRPLSAATKPAVPPMTPAATTTTRHRAPATQPL